MREEDIKRGLNQLGIKAEDLNRAGICMEQLQDVTAIAQELFTAKQYFIITIDPDRGEQEEVRSYIQGLTLDELPGLTQEVIGHHQRNNNLIGQVNNILDADSPA